MASTEHTDREACGGRTAASSTVAVAVAIALEKGL